MTTGLIVAGIVVLVALVVALRWRSGGGEQQALRHYQQALDTLRTVNDRIEPSRTVGVPRVSSDRTETRNGSENRSNTPSKQGAEVSAWSAQRPVESRLAPPRATTQRATSARAIAEARAAAAAAAAPPAAPAEPAERVEKPRPEEVSPEASPEVSDGSDSRTPLVFDDSAAPDKAAAEPLGEQRPTRANMRALQRSARPPSRIPAVTGIVIVVIALSVVAYLTVRHSPNHSGTTATTTKTNNHTTATTTRVTQNTTPPSSTTTTTTPTVSPIASTATSQTATYNAPDAPYNVTLTSSGACWVYAKLVATGTTLWTGVLYPGQSQVLHATGQLEVQLGHSNTMAVTMNGETVQYPSGSQAVFTMQFVPAT